MLQITVSGTSYLKVFRKIVSMRKLNSRFNNHFYSLNVIECTLECQYISVTLYLLQTYPSGKPLFKGQGLVNLIVHAMTDLVDLGQIG